MIVITHIRIDEEISIKCRYHPSDFMGEVLKLHRTMMSCYATF